MAFEGINNEDGFDQIDSLDAELSNRFIALDPRGYFIIKVDESSQELVVEHYGNDIDEHGIAVDPETGKPIECHEGRQRMPITVYKGRTAKEVGIKLTEGASPSPLSRLDHALYLGRELQKAESCLRSKKHYVQD
tara:strand:+ start:186 stop:590 length:405 start_codon:yes stop_codon:yes gene_type:complete